ncbi:MAG: hypothetical protein QXX08_04595 [Candidatus Bathyarchaeia archaeon]
MERFTTLALDGWTRHLLDPDEVGMIGERVAVRAFACPQCGYIEH